MYHYIVLGYCRKTLSKRCTNATFSILLDCPNAKAYSRRKLQICKHQTVYTYVGIHTVCTTICDSCTISRYDGFVLHKSGKWQIGFHSILNDAKYSSIARKYWKTKNRNICMSMWKYTVFSIWLIVSGKKQASVHCIPAALLVFEWITQQKHDQKRSAQAGSSVRHTPTLFFCHQTSAYLSSIYVNHYIIYLYIYIHIYIYTYIHVHECDIVFPNS